VTPDPLLRRLYLAHAIDELHHADLFRERGAALLQARPARRDAAVGGLASFRRPRIDDLRVEDEARRVAPRVPACRGKGRRRPLHDLSRRRAGRPSTRAVFEEILRDEVFHMNYTYTQLARVSPERYRRRVWRARASVCGSGICGWPRRSPA